MKKNRKIIISIGITIIVIAIIALMLNFNTNEERIVHKIEFSELTRSHWSTQDLENAKATINFVQKIMNDHDFEYIKNLYKNTHYKQHNRGMSDGIDGVISTLVKFTRQYPNFSYDVKNIYVDGSYVTIHSHGTLKASDRGNPNKGLNIYDTWKIENGILIEHWDSIQGIDGSMRFYNLITGGEINNNNTLF